MSDQDIIPPKVRRSKDKRPYIYDPVKGKEVLYSRVSTFAKALSDGAGLAAWKMRMAYTGLSQYPQLLGASERSDIDLRLSEAMDLAGANDAANMGTALHGLTEFIDMESGPLSPDDWSLSPVVWDALDRYVEVTKDLEPLECEQFVVNDEFRVAGTFDRAYRLPDGRVVIGDIKTGGMLRMQEHAVQLFLYASAQRYDVKTGARHPLEVDQELGLIVWVPADPAAGDARLVGVDLNAGRELALLAQRVRASRTQKVEADVSIITEGKRSE